MALLPSLLGAAPPVRFTRLSVEQGLSQSSVQAILQDHTGFVWLGTDEGLNRYDGYEFVVFRHDPHDPRSLPNDTVLALHEDRQHRLWVGTERGLGLFDPGTQTFTRIPSVRERIAGIVEDPDGTLWVASEGAGLFERDPGTGAFVLHDANPDNPGSLASYGLSALFRDRRGRLWIGTRNHGVDMLDRSRGTPPAAATQRIPERTASGPAFVHYRHDPRDPRSLPHDEVWGFAEDGQGDLWVATYGGGVSVLDSETGTFRHYRHDPRDPGSLRTDLVTCVFVDRSGSVWVGTDGGGIERYDAASDRFIPLLHDPADAHSLSQNVVRRLYEDVQGQLWVGTYLGGVNVLKRPRRDFRYFTHDAHDPSSLSDAGATFLEDAEGRLWVGTGQGWLDRFEPETGSFTHHLFRSAWPKGLAILAMRQDRRGRIWMGSYRGGLGRFDPGSGSLALFRHRSGDQGSVGNDEVWALAEDEQGALWLGTNAGLDHFDPDTGSVTAHYDTYRPEGLSHAGVRVLLRDRRGNLWVGTLGGLNLLLRGGGGFVRYRHDERDPRSLSHDSVIALHEDRRGRLWVGTFGGGLNLLDQLTGTFTSYKGLPSNVVYGIEEEVSGRLWLSSNHGLSRFDPETGHVENFDLSNGLQSLQFRIGASLRTRGGRMLFASVDGFYYFDPDSIRPASYAPPVVFTSLRVVDKPDRPPIALSGRDEVSLGPEDRVLSFEFAALDYSFPRRNQYTYFMDGFTEKWIPLGTRRDVTFTELDPGSYVLRVKASNSDGVWNETASAALRVVVLPPFWRTWWFRGLAAALVVLVLVAAHRFRVRQLTADISERKRVEAALRRAEEKYRSIVDNAMEGLFQASSGGRFLTVNPALARMLGYASPEEMVAEVKDIEAQLYVEPGRRGEMLSLLREHGAVRGFECEVRRRDGGSLWVSLNVRIVADETGRALYNEGICQDISDRRRARQAEAALRAALQREAEEWEVTFDSLEGPILIVDAEGRIVRLNRAARELVASVSHQDALGRSVAEVAPGEPWQKASEVAALAGKTRAATHGQARDGASGQTWDLMARPSPGGNGDGDRVIVVAREITRMAEP